MDQPPSSRTENEESTKVLIERVQDTRKETKFPPRESLEFSFTKERRTHMTDSGVETL